MGSRAIKLRLILLVLGLPILPGLALGGDQLVAAQQVESLQGAAVRLVAERTGTPVSRLIVVNLAEARYPALGSVGYSAKVLDTATGTVEGVVLDRAHRPLDPGQLRASDRARQVAGGAVFEPVLGELLATAAPEQPIPVVLWLREPPWPRPPRLGPARIAAPGAQEAARASDAAAMAARAAALQQVVGPVLARLQQVGVAASSPGAAPLVHASMPAWLLPELRTWSEIEHVYLGRVSQPDGTAQLSTIHADIVQAQGMTGAGVQVAQIEPNGRVATANPYLAGVVQDATYACATPSDHATAVAGILRSTLATLLGVAPGMSLRVGGSCSGTSMELNDRASAAADWGASVFSLSYSTDTNRMPVADDRFYDDMVFNRRRAVVKSAGNLGQTTGDVTSPGLGYNVLTVGDFDDAQTASWADDAMNPTSSYLGPLSTHGDRRKPELAAPGTNVQSLSVASPWFGFTSTGASFATPHVAGTVALMLQRNGSLAQWPEAVRAILLATAVNPLAGNPSLANRGGAGGVVADRADSVVQHVGGDWGAQPYDCSAGSPLDVATVTLPSGQRMRAAIAWNTDPNWAGWPSQPGTDLDLAIVGPAGGGPVVSASQDNSYELVDFVAWASGTYVLRVSRARCDSSPGGLAWAWHLTPSASVLINGTPTPQPTAPPAFTATSTATPTPPPICVPTRPQVSVSTVPSAGQLVVTIQTQTLPGGSVNAIQALRFGAPTNALIDVAGVTGRTGNFSVTISPVSVQTTFVVRRATPGQAATVPLTVVDGCGDWPTLVGGGPQAF